MLAFIRALRRDGHLLTRLPGLPIAFVIAELFYKFRSFALECGAFLVTWAVIDLAAEALLKRFAPHGVPRASLQGAAGGSYASQEEEAAGSQGEA